MKVGLKVLAIVGVGAILAVLAYVVAHGTLRSFALGFAVGLALPLGYLAIERPMVFPFGLYAALVPFNDALSFGSGTINKLLAMLAFAAVLFILLRRGEIAKPSRAVLAWLAVGVWMGLSGFWTIDIQAWQLQYLTFAQLFTLYALMALAITTKADIEVVCTCIVTGGLAASAVALWPLIVGGAPYGLGGRVTLPGGPSWDPLDPNQFAAGLLLPFGILFTATLSTRKALPLLVNISGIVLIAIAIVLSGSRAAMLATLVLMVFTAFRTRYRFTAALLLAFAGVAILPFWTTVLDRFSSALSSGGAGREDIWRVALIAFRDNWLFGTGFGSFPAAFDNAVMRAHLHMYISWHRAPHDLLLATAVELGLVGILLVAFALFMEYRSIASLPSAPGFLSDLGIALQATLLATCIDALFLDVTNRKYLWLLFIMIALVRSTVLCAVESERERRRTVCAVPSSPMPAPISVPERPRELSSLLKTAG